VIDTKKEKIAVAEANKLGIPVIAIVDTNSDPDVIDFPIPGNDDSFKAIEMITRQITDTAAEIRTAREKEKEAARQKEEKAARAVAS
jgi:small subunit ribosomal protein S2